MFSSLKSIKFPTYFLRGEAPQVLVSPYVYQSATYKCDGDYGTLGFRATYNTHFGIRGWRDYLFINGKYTDGWMIDPHPDYGEVVFPYRINNTGWLIAHNLKSLIFQGKAIIVPPNSWLTQSTIEAIMTAFGSPDGFAVLDATNDYLNTLAAQDPAKAAALAAYINEDPMLVCSLGLEPEGVTMPIRFMVSDGNAYVKTNYHFTDADSVIEIQFLRMTTNRAEWVFGERNNIEGNTNYPIQCTFTAYNESRIAYGPNTIGIATPFSTGIDLSKPCRMLLRKNECVINGIQQAIEPYVTLPQGSDLCIYSIFRQNTDHEVYTNLIFIGGIGHFAIDGNNPALFIQKRVNGAWTMIDAWGDVTTERVGTFTMEYRLPNGNIWTPNQ